MHGCYVELPTTAARNIRRKSEAQVGSDLRLLGMIVYQNPMSRRYKKCHMSYSMNGSEDDVL
jgi:hypothetical protein